MSTPAPSLPWWVLLRVFVRSLFLQASWNPQGMQNLGLAYALFPALTELYPDPPAQLAALRRHLTFFNTHPYVAAAILGGVIYHEERIARGEESPDRVMAFKAALMVNQAGTPRMKLSNTVRSMRPPRPALRFQARIDWTR